MRSMRRLMRDPTRQRTVTVGHRQKSVRLHRHAGKTLTHHRHLGDHVCAVERVFVISMGSSRSKRSTHARKQERRTRFECRGRCHQNRQRFDVEENGFCRVHGLSFRFGDDGGADVADEPDPIGAEHRAIQRGGIIGNICSDGNPRSLPA